MTYMSVFFHRAFTHQGITLSPWLRKFVIHTSSWVTGLDLKGWVCMHRMHHAFVDTEKDPHSPVFFGVAGVFLAQHHSFQKTLLGLHGKRRTYTSYVEDLDFPVSILNRKKWFWLFPLSLHLGIGFLIGYALSMPLMGVAYFMGMISHPIQGWIVNSICHRYGYRNYATSDASKNNTLAGLFLIGEGYHNNHHQHPSSAKFSRRWFEFDLGYAICLGLQFFGWAKINKSTIVYKLQPSNPVQDTDSGAIPVNL